MEPREKFSGYRVAACCFLVAGVTFSFSLTYSLFLPYFCEAFDAPLGNVTLMHSISCIIGVILNVFVAKFFVKRFGIRAGAMVGAVLSSLAYVLYAIAPNLIVVYIGAALNGATHSFGQQVYTTSCGANWFYTGRKTVSTVFMAAHSVCTVGAMLVAGSLLDTVSWRTAWMIIAVIVFVISFISSLLIIDSPEKVGQKMLGYEKMLADQAAISKDAKEEPSITDIQARKTMFYWLLIIVTLFVGMCGTSLTSFGPVYWQGTGMSGLLSSRMSSIASVGTLVSTIGIGILAEKFDLRKICIGTLTIGTIGIVAVVSLGGSANPAIIAVATFAAAFVIGTANSYVVTMIPLVFGPKYFNQISGPFIALFAVAGTINPILFGKMVDFTGGYKLSWTVELTLLAIGFVSMIVLATMYKKTKERTIKIYNETEGNE